MKQYQDDLIKKLGHVFAVDEENKKASSDSLSYSGRCSFFGKQQNRRMNHAKEAFQTTFNQHKLLLCCSGFNPHIVGVCPKHWRPLFPTTNPGFTNRQIDFRNKRDVRPSMSFSQRGAYWRSLTRADVSHSCTITHTHPYPIPACNHMQSYPSLATRERVLQEELT